MIIGVLSDTHGELCPEVRAKLAGVDHILHAGDIGSAAVLEELRKIGPVTAVRWNCDLDAWCRSLPTSTTVELGGARILLGHQRERLGPPDGYAMVVTGHSHIAAIEERDGVLLLNPGSAGPCRFSRPRTMARVEIEDCRLTAEIATLGG
jgi:uncharacterized protein